MMDFNKEDYIIKTTSLIKTFWLDLSQSICAGRRVKRCPFQIECALGSCKNSLCPEINKHVETVCRKVVGNKIPNAEDVYAHNFYLTINDNDTVHKKILLESWQLTWEDKPYSSKYENVHDQIENLLKVATLQSMCMPMHKLTLENLVPPFDCSFYTYQFCSQGAVKGCQLHASPKKRTICVGSVRTKLTQATLHVSFVPEIDLNEFADDVRAIEIIPNYADMFKSKEFGSTPELQFIPDDFLQLRNESEYLQERPTNVQLEESVESPKGSMLDVTCAFADGKDALSEEVKQDILDSHRLSMLEDELMKSFHKTLSIPKLVEANKAAEQGTILNKKIGEVLDNSSVTVDGKAKALKITPRNSRCLPTSPSLPTDSPFSAAPLVNTLERPRPASSSPRSGPEAAQLSEVSKQLLVENNATTGDSGEAGAKFHDVMAPFADDNQSDDLATMFALFKNAPEINFRSTNELKDLESQFEYYEEMKKKGEDLYEKVKRERREQEESSGKD